MESRVVHFEIQADDVDRAKKFYQNVFNWEISQMMTEAEGGMDYWGLKTGADGTPGINGGLYKRRPDNVIHTFDCTIQVDDIDKAMEAVKANGGTLQGEKMEIPGVGWFITGNDTEGNKFGIMQPTEWEAK
jgi:predicted enzyme related to lactoylglutathione lyase